MKKKIKAIEAAALILGTIILSSTSAQSIQICNSTQDSCSIQEELTTNENIINLEYEPTCLGSIYGYTTFLDPSSMVGWAALCRVTVRSEEANIYRSCISWSSYKIENLPIGYTYTVTASHSLNEIVTLTSDEPNARVDFVFDKDDAVKNDIKPIAHDVEYFISCTITGTYTEEIINNGTSINVKSDTKSIKITGTAQIYGINPGFPHFAFRSIKTDEVSTQNFQGICSNGKVIGKGFWYVRIGDYESLIKSKPATPRFFNLIEKIFERNTLLKIFEKS